MYIGFEGIVCSDNVEEFVIENVAFTANQWHLNHTHSQALACAVFFFALNNSVIRFMTASNKLHKLAFCQTQLLGQFLFQMQTFGNIMITVSVFMCTFEKEVEVPVLVTGTL